MFALQLSRARSAFEDYADEAVTYVDNINGAVQNMAEFYYGFKDWVSSAGVDTSDLDSWFDMSFDTFLVLHTLHTCLFFFFPEWHKKRTAIYSHCLILLLIALYKT
jgi:hypothetical protein